ncbi:Heterokaryon incompatibility protein (HET) domain containing protein [Hyaloscypha variabilis]
MDSFQYKPLDRKKHEIRIIILYPGCDGPIQCSLAAVSLDDAEEYEALSYTWGDVNQQTFIIVDGVDHAITVNAAIALWHLRRKQSSRNLWIDTLCINQQDDEERIHQVQLMKHIYSKASNVLAWLGPSFDDSDFAMDLIEDFGNKLERQPRPTSSQATHFQSRRKPRSYP